MSPKPFARALAFLLAGLVAGCQARPEATVVPTTAFTATPVASVTERVHATHAETEDVPAATVTPEAITPPAPTGQFDVAGAKSVTVVAGLSETVYVMVGRGEDLVLYRSDDGARTFGAGVLVSQGTHAEVLAVVRPALAVRADGRLTAAWVEFGSAGESKVRVTHSDDAGQTFGVPAMLVSTTDPETTMVSLAFDLTGEPLVTWLQNSSVRFATGASAGTVYGQPQVADDLVCECCQPQPLAVVDQVLVAYRNLVRDAAGQASRDIHVAASSDGGVTFAEPIKVSDASWLIDACPIAGPALASHAETLYVAWMDGRFDDGTFSRTDVWLAASADGGASFGLNVRVNAVEGGYNGQPSMVVDAHGRVHVAWSADTETGSALNYAISTDGGASFGAARELVASAGRLGSPVLAISAAGQIYGAWTDAGGAHVLPVH